MTNTSFASHLCVLILLFPSYTALNLERAIKPIHNNLLCNEMSQTLVSAIKIHTAT